MGNWLSFAAALGAAIVLAQVPAAQGDDSAAPMKVPMVIPRGQKDIALVPSGTYTLDPNHVAVIARVSHMDFSISIFRFERVSATLDWKREAPEDSKLDAHVDTASIATNVAGFAAQLSGKDYLNSSAFPEASFVSSRFHKLDSTHGTVDGQFTLMGKTKPVTFDVTLIGAGPGFAGGPVIGHVIGVEARTSIDPQSFGLPAIFTDPIDIVVDTEFDRKPG